MKASLNKSSSSESFSGSFQNTQIDQNRRLTHCKNKLCTWNNPSTKVNPQN